MPTLDEINQLEQAGQITSGTAEQMRQRLVINSQFGEAPTQIQPTQPILETPEAAQAVANNATESQDFLANQSAATANMLGLPTSAIADLNQPAMQGLNQVQGNAQQILGQNPVPQPEETIPQSIPQDFIQPQQSVAAQPVNPFQDEMQGIKSGYNRQIDALKDAANAGAQQAATEAGYLKELETQLSQQEQARQQRADERRKFADSELKKIDEINQEMHNSKVDPDRYWNSKSTGQKILAGIGIILGGLGGALTGKGNNPALDVINNAIKNDIDAQKAEIEKLKSVGGMRKNLYSMMLAKFDNEEQAEAATTMSMLNQTQIKLKQAAAQHKAPQIQARAEQAIGQLEVAKNTAAAQFEAATMKKFPTSLLKDGKLPEGMSIDVLPEKMQKRYVPGLGLANTPKDADILKEATEKKKSFDRKIDRLIELRNTYGGEILNRDAVAEGKLLSRDLLLIYKDLAKLGVLSEADEAIINEIIPKDPLEFTPFSSLTGQDPILTKLKIFKQNSNADYNTKVSTRLSSNLGQVKSFKPNN